MTSCYGDLIDGVGLVGNLPANLSQRLSDKNVIPVVLMAKKFTDLLLPVPLKFRHKLQLFIIETSSWQLLDATIRNNIRQTIWWNHMASYIILDRSPGCVNEVVQSYLLLAWYRKMLNVKVMCYDHKVGRTIVSYNPFTGQAPAPWQRIGVVTKNIQHPFTLFSRNYRRSNEICVHLDMDKTKNLDGYAIVVEGLAPTADYTIGSKTLLSSADQQTSTHDRIFDIIGRFMNGSLHYTNQTRWHERTMYADIDKKTTTMHGAWVDKAITYPHVQITMIIVSKFRRPNPQQSAVLTGIDIYSRIGMAIADLITVLFLKFFIRQALMPALIDLVRIACNNPMINLARTDLPRIYLASFLSSAAIMHVFYQSSLASLMTSQISLRNADTVEDLLDYDFKIYGLPLSTPRVDIPGFKERFTKIQGTHAVSCIQHAQHNLSTACIWWQFDSVIEMARKSNLHVGRDYVMAVYGGFKIRQGWPLEERVNIIVGRLVEGDLLQPWDIKCKPDKLSDFQIDKAAVGSIKFKKVELAQLAVPFAILGTGLALATVTFIIEFVINYECAILIVSR